MAPVPTDVNQLASAVKSIVVDDGKLVFTELISI
jgi:hypothetical protein